MFRNIIWDVDGTLFNTYPAIARAFQAALDDLGKNASLEWIEGLARKSLGYCVTTLAGQYQLNEKEIGQAFEDHYDRNSPEEQPPFPGVIAVCEYIHTLGGLNVIITHRDHNSTDELLAAYKMTHLITACLARDDGFPKKPHPASFEAMLKMYNLERDETLAVGDRDIDVQAGQAAGLFTCLFDQKDEGGTADLTISSFDKLYRYLVLKNS